MYVSCVQDDASETACWFSRTCRLIQPELRLAFHGMLFIHCSEGGATLNLPSHTYDERKEAGSEELSKREGVL